MPHPAMRRAAALLALVAALPFAAFAGPITPPPGPVAPTGKTLAQVEPRTPIGPDTTPGHALAVHAITQSGSYYLTGDILVNTSGQDAIRISAPNVTLDLNGFTIRGDNLSTSTGILLTSAATGAVIRNGAIQDLRERGVDGDDSARVENLTVINCGATNESGIVLGDRATVVGCTVTDCGLTGILVGENSLVVRCTSNGSQNGILVRPGCLVADCTASNNSFDGFASLSPGSSFRNCSADNNAGRGFNLFGPNVLDGCAARGNGGPGGGGGMALGGGSTVRSCTSSNNTGFGFSTSSGVTFDGCTVVGNTAQGLAAGSNLTITGCTFSGNGTGIGVNDGCIITNCVIDSSTTAASGYGVSVRNGNTISSCTVRANASPGILAASTNHIIGCTLDANAVANISVSGTGNRIDSNTVTPAASTTGITAAAGANVIIRNTVSARGLAGVTPFSLGAGNTFGPIINATAGGDLSSIPAASHPWANFRF